MSSSVLDSGPETAPCFESIFHAAGDFEEVSRVVSARVEGRNSANKSEADGDVLRRRRG